MRKSLVVSLIAILMVVVVGSTALAASLRIGLSIPSLSMTWFSFLKNAVEQQAAEMGVELVTLDARNQVGKQMSDIEDMIVQGLDGVLLVPINVEALVPAVESLNAANIPVVTVDRRIVGAPTLCHVGADNVDGGRTAGLFIAHLLKGEGRVIELTGTPGSSPAIDRGSGFNEVIAQFPNIKVIAQQTGQFTRAEGMTVMENLIQAHPEFDAVFAHNDDMIVGAIEAIKGSGLKMDEVITVGFDAIEDALRAVKRQELDATIEQFPGDQAKTAFKILVDFVRTGEKPASNEIYIKPGLVMSGTLDKAENWPRVKAEF
ncbi:MAG: substrate-binding domain-containing protein [Firmicutes bacterium]|nr:substrate-binding domain-containing protein [Bacillota bacterium]